MQVIGWMEGVGVSGVFFRCGLFVSSRSSRFRRGINHNLLESMGYITYPLHLPRHASHGWVRVAVSCCLDLAHMLRSWQHLR
jgi:hypothetical protein